MIDTNVVYAGLRSKLGASFALLTAISEEKVSYSLSTALIFEYEDVLKRNQNDLAFTEKQIDELLDSLVALSNPFSPYFLWRPILRDAKDDMVLELAVVSGAESIITFNTRDFEGSLKFGIKAVGPLDYLRKEKLL